MLRIEKSGFLGSGGMRAKAAVCFTAIALLLSSVAFAEVAHRSLELELDDVPDSTGYEIRVTRVLQDKSKKPPVIFKIKGNQWSAKLVPGKYTMEVRSFDSRHVPGPWGDPQEFVVKLPAAEQVAPHPKESIKSEESKQEKVTFEWKPVEGAEVYKLKILNADGTTVQESVEKDTSTKVKLPVGLEYKWSVAPVMEGELEGDTAENPNTFEIIGGKLDTPKVLPVDDVNTIDFNWVQTQYANDYKFTLESQGKDGQWKSFDNKDVKVTHRAYKNPVPTGKYRLTVVAKADRRLDSEPAVVEFKTTYLNTRSPAAVEQVKEETSYDSKRIIFGIASYYASFVSYSGSNSDIAGQPYGTSFKNVIGGTGRLGIGTWFKEDNKLGLMTVGDLSGFTFQDSTGATATQTYYSQTLQGVYRERLGAVGQLRLFFGGQYRNLPVAMSDNPSINQARESMIITIGPTVGASILHGFTHKLGAQLNFQLMDSIYGVTTPNGQANVPALSYQLGVLGSLNLTPQLVGFMGYAFRDEKASYAIKSGSSATGNNTSEITGHYINFLLEYGF